jgi:hypothetical protein
LLPMWCKRRRHFVRATNRTPDIPRSGQSFSLTADVGVCRTYFR